MLLFSYRKKRKYKELEVIIIQKVFSIFAQNLAYYNEGSIEGDG